MLYIFIDYAITNPFYFVDFSLSLTLDNKSRWTTGQLSDQ